MLACPETPLDEDIAMYMAYYAAIAAHAHPTQFQERILRSNSADRDAATVGLWLHAVLYLLAEYANVSLKDQLHKLPDEMMQELYAHPRVVALFETLEQSMQARAPYEQVVAPLRQCALDHGMHRRPEWCWRIVEQIYTTPNGLYVEQEESREEEQEVTEPFDFQAYCAQVPLPKRDRVIALYGTIDLEGNARVLDTRYESSLRPGENPDFPQGDAADIVARIVPPVFP